MKIIEKKKSFAMRVGVELTLHDLIIATLSDPLHLSVDGENIQIDSDDIFTVKASGKTVDLNQVKITVKINDTSYLKDINKRLISEAVDIELSE